MKAELTDRGPIGAVGFAQDKGWMNGEVFLKWMQHFVKYAKPSNETNALLLLDGHSSHKSLEVLIFAKKKQRDPILLSTTLHPQIAAVKCQFLWPA